jgi:hypothetical protein
MYSCAIVFFLALDNFEYWFVPAVHHNLVPGGLFGHHNTYIQYGMLTPVAGWPLPALGVWNLV